MPKSSLFKAYYIFIPLLLIGISLGYTNFNIAFATLLPLLFMTNRHTIGIFLIMYGGPFGGVIRTMYPFLPVYGLLFQLIGFLLIWDLITDLFRNNLRALGLMALLLSVFGIFYIIGPQDKWAIDKYSAMCNNGFIMVFCYYAYCRSSVVEAEGLLLLLFVAAVCMFAYMVSVLNLRPGLIYDYNWFRTQITALDREYREYGGTNAVVTYQHIGMLVAYAVAIVLSQVKIKKGVAILFIICGLHATLMSGCRQAVLAIVIVVTLRAVVFTVSNLQQRMSIARVVWMSTGLIVAFFAINILLENVQSDAITNTLEEGDAGREEQYLDAWNIFLKHPIYGAGIGGYQAITGDTWPHNFFLEALCETGLVGTITIIAIAIVVLVRKRTGLFFLTESNMFYFLLFIPLFIRIMVSCDFRESIELFSAIFAITAVNNTCINDNTE
ncbi:MAG: O-antigen ligase family protein [Salinivirgaceae bacterium]|nr:O-antigen ligase family protein [Salinivirgaceae bacterium]